MTKIKKLNKLKKYNIFYFKNEIKIKYYKSIYKNLNMPYFFRYYFYYKYLQLNFKTKNIKLSCILSGRNRSKYSFFNVSRIKIRELASYRNLTGVRKSS